MTGRDTWTLADIPDLSGRQALVTGVTSGLGEHTATELARAGATVLLAARNPAKLESTTDKLLADVPGAVVRPLVLDLADLSSVRRAAKEAASYGPLDILVNNAGVMATPHELTADGFELQFGTNHLGHFALTGLLMESLLAAPAPRVVTVSSQMARSVRGVSLKDPRRQGGRYHKWNAYGQSKLANLLFTLELDRRVRAKNLPLTAVAAHPGYSHTNLVDAGMNKGRRRVDGAIALAITPLVSQSSAMGALPQLMAATAPDLEGGAYVGPRGPFQLHGSPTLVGYPGPAKDTERARGLWELSQQATGVVYP